MPQGKYLLQVYSYASKGLCEKVLFSRPNLCLPGIFSDSLMHITDLDVCTPVSQPVTPRLSRQERGQQRSGQGTHLGGQAPRSQDHQRGAPQGGHRRAQGAGVGAQKLGSNCFAGVRYKAPSVGADASGPPSMTSDTCSRHAHASHLFVCQDEVGSQHGRTPGSCQQLMRAHAELTGHQGLVIMLILHCNAAQGCLVAAFPYAAGAVAMQGPEGAIRLLSLTGQMRSSTAARRTS